MIRCIIADCTWKSSTYDRLYEHLSKYHGELTRYTCNVEKCTRTYGIRSSFIRHFKSHFVSHVNQSSLVSTDKDKILLADADSNIPTDLSQHIFPPCSSDLQNYARNSTDNNTVFVPENFSTIQNNLIESMSKLSLELNLKWLNINSMPRKTVFDLQHDLQNKIFAPLQQIFNTLAATGLVTQTGKEILDSTIDCFSNIETEYKFKQNLRKLDLYVDPREFVISNQLQPGVVNNVQQIENDPITGAWRILKLQLDK